MLQTIGWVDAFPCLRVNYKYFSERNAASNKSYQQKFFENAFHNKYYKVEVDGVYRYNYFCLIL